MQKDEVVEMSGKLIVIEGLDGSGKSTQLGLLADRIEAAGKTVKKIKLPNYDDPACELVKMYLGGRFGTSPDAVNAYAASTFYAVDRYVSYNCLWKEDYLSGAVILADRYTTSNAYHQLTKLPKEQWDEYLAWLEEFEYGKLGIPKPDKVVYLDMPIEVSQKLMTARYSGDENKKDIHEKNVQYLLSCREGASYAAEKLGWTVVECASEGEALPIDVIAAKIQSAIM